MDGLDFSVEVIKTSRKKSVEIQVNDGRVSVRAPQSLSDKHIRDLILKRSSWVTAKIKEQSERPASKPKEYISGEGFSYLGKTYRLQVGEGSESSLKLKGGMLVVSVPGRIKDRGAEVKRLLIEWYQVHAEQKLLEKVKLFAPIIGVEPKSVVVKSYKSRWGSCSSRGDISFNWKIIAAPHRIVDYVVIHELCHLLEHNHSPKYWKYVEKHIPDWKACRNWLKKNLQSSL